MTLEEKAKIVEAEASILPYAGKLAVAQCIKDLDDNASAFTEPAKEYSADSMRAVVAVENGKRRFPDAKILQFRSFKKYGDGHGNPDWEKLKGGRWPIPDDLIYLGKDGLDDQWGHFYFGKEIKHMKILVIAGHGDGDPGAIGCGYEEATLTRELAGRIVECGKEAGYDFVLADTSKNMYKYLKAGNKYDFTPYGYVLEIHFNASVNTDYKGDGIMKGSMFYISKSETGHSVEDRILNNLYAIGSRKAWNGVVITGVDQSTTYLVQETVRKQGVSHGLLETCFISDRDDMNWYQANKAQIAHAIVNGIVDGFKLNKSGSTFQPYMVKVVDDALNIRSGIGIDYPVVGCITDHGSYTIVDEGIAPSDGAKWGKLKSGAGWINLTYTRR